jgi:hypothetical protein
VKTALAAAARGGRSATKVIAAFAALDARVAYWSERHPRPATNRARSLGRSLKLLRQGLWVFATALGSPTMLDAQAREREGQSLIDAAVDEINMLFQINESEQLLESPEGFGPIGSSARSAAGGDDAIARLDERLQQLAGRDPSDLSSGIGLNLHLFRHIMMVLLDLEECLEVSRVAEGQLSDLPDICSDPRWQARHGVVTAQFSTAAFQLSTIDESNDLEAVSTALNLVMQCRDGVVRHCLATMLATDADDFQRLMRKQSGQIIKTASRRFPEFRLDENLSQTLSHAGAHFDYDVEDGDTFVARTSTGDEVRLTVDEFLDQVLGYVQTSVSLLFALMSASASQGVQFELSRHTPERDLLSTMMMLMGFTGFTDASVSRDGELLN